MRFVAVLAAFVTAVPAAAHAGTVVMRPAAAGGVIVVYAASAGESNRVAVRGLYTADFGGALGSHAIVVSDAGAPVQAPAECEQPDRHTARCPTGGFALTPVVVDAGDGDDIVTIAAFGATGGGLAPDVVRGGTGADVLSGPATLIGDEGNDVLTGSDSGSCGKYMNYCSELLIGGSGDDLLRALGGDDRLVGDGDANAVVDRGGGNDVLDGGAGEDHLLFPGRAEGVRVDLAARVSRGASGELDRIAGIEYVHGGDGPDVLRGDDDPNDLYGGSGADVLDGRGGNDELYDTAPASLGRDNSDPDTLRGGAGSDRLNSGGGRDRLDGGSGSDWLSASVPRSVRCGDGYDRVFLQRPVALAGCEQFGSARSGVTVAASSRAAGAKRLRLRVLCGASPTFVRCDLRVAVRLPATRRAVRRLSIHHHPLPQRYMTVRSARRLRRGDVVVLAVAGTVDHGPAGLTRVDERWQVRL